MACLQKRNESQSNHTLVALHALSLALQLVCWCLAFSPLCRFAPRLIRPLTLDDSP